MCTLPNCITAVQQVIPCIEVKCKSQGRTAASTERESYQLPSGDVVGCASDTDVHGALDTTELSASVAWGNLVAALSLYILSYLYMLFPIRYSAGQAKKPKYV